MKLNIKQLRTATMSHTKRKFLFHKYSKQFKEIVQAGLYPFVLPDEEVYLCPICLEPFCEKDLNTELKIHLTLEDAPPASLGGSANTLTCKRCNNESGHMFDSHLFKFLNEMEIRNFLPNTSAAVLVEHEGKKVQGLLEVDSAGAITIMHHIKKNNPAELESYVDVTGKGDTPQLYFKASKVDTKMVDVALLKTAYILAFVHYGYPLILSKAFDVVRDQIRNPKKEIYPSGFWHKEEQFKDSNTGVHFITTNGWEGLLAIFTLKTESGNKSGYSVYLPDSVHTYKEVVENFKQMKAGHVLEMSSYMNTDYFNDKESMKLCSDYMAKKNE